MLTQTITMLILTKLDQCGRSRPQLLGFFQKQIFVVLNDTEIMSHDWRASGVECTFFGPVMELYHKVFYRR